MSFGLPLRTRPELDRSLRAQNRRKARRKQLVKTYVFTYLLTYLSSLGLGLPRAVKQYLDPPDIFGNGNLMMPEAFYDAHSLSAAKPLCVQGHYRRCFMLFYLTLSYLTCNFPYVFSLVDLMQRSHNLTIPLIDNDMLRKNFSYILQFGDIY